MARNFEKLPSYLIQYHEYDKKVEYPVEMHQIPMEIDGLFNPYATDRFSLGCLRNFRRRAQTLDCLTKIGLGVIFTKTPNDRYIVTNLSNYPVYIILNRSPNEQIMLESREKKELFDLTPLINHKILPKRLGHIYEDYSLKISFRAPFEKIEHIFLSPCWIEMSMNKMFIFNLLKPKIIKITPETTINLVPNDIDDLNPRLKEYVKKRKVELNCVEDMQSQAALLELLSALKLFNRCLSEQQNEETVTEEAPTSQGQSLHGKDTEKLAFDRYSCYEEWKQAALVIDRMLFIVYVIIMPLTGLEFFRNNVGEYMDSASKIEKPMNYANFC